MEYVDSDNLSFYFGKFLFLYAMRACYPIQQLITFQFCYYIQYQGLMMKKFKYIFVEYKILIFPNSKESLNINLLYQY